MRKRATKINFGVLCDRFYLLIMLVDIKQKKKRITILNNAIY